VTDCLPYKLPVRHQASKMSLDDEPSQRRASILDVDFT